MTRQTLWPSQSIAVIGAGITGLGAAWALAHAGHKVTVYEKNSRPGGHANTALITARARDGRLRSTAVDTGFIVYNDRNYPNLIGLFDHLDVATEASDMSFAVSMNDGKMEWSGTSISTLFAQKKNFLRPSFHRFWLDILRFNRLMTRDLETGALAGRTLGQYIDAQGLGLAFRKDYLLPMAAAIWSAPFAEMLQFPAETFGSFFRNHGLLGVYNRPQWRTVTGGSRRYLARLLQAGKFELKLDAAAVQIEPKGREWRITDRTGYSEVFNHILFACHPDEALNSLGGNADPAERQILSAIRYQPNIAYLHQDESLMPKRRKVWSSWNYTGHDNLMDGRQVAVTYWMNKLQNLDPDFPLFVSLNPIAPPDAHSILGVYHYDHPLFDAAAIAAQGQLDDIQGRRNLWFAGAWSGYGFHEDGLKSGLRVALALGAKLPWRHDLTPAGGYMAPLAQAS